jgi:hypothetical protein
MSVNGTARKQVPSGWLVSYAPACEPWIWYVNFFYLSGVVRNRVHYYWGHYWPIVPAPDDDGQWWAWSSRRNALQGKQKSSEKTCPSAALSTTNPRWLGLSSNPDLRGGKPATNRLSYDTVLWYDQPPQCSPVTHIVTVTLSARFLACAVWINT